MEILTVNPDWRNRYEVAIDAARRAGQHALRYFDGPFTVERKDDESPVTVADRESEQLLRTVLHDAFPGDGFLGEEYGDAPGTSGYRWVLDPIDGTRNFVRGIPIWATLVGLEYKGEPIAGVAEVPAMAQRFRALRGDGAYRIVGPPGTRPSTGFSPLQAGGERRIKVSDRTDLADSLLFYSSLSWFVKAGCEAAFLELTRRTEMQRGFGDFYGYLLVAQGSGEVMMEHGVHAWDIAALLPIIEEAGGRMTAWDGTRTIHRPDSLASNGALHDQVLRILGEQRSK
jgi:histidinol-phosphatase